MGGVEVVGVKRVTRLTCPSDIAADREVRSVRYEV